MAKTWFPEPTNEDNTYASRLEGTISWLQRSTVARAQDYRRFLNYNLNCLPKDIRLPIYDALHERWHTGLFELIVARTLQELGADIELEIENADGKRPDFKAHFVRQTVVVEATSPVINSDVGDEMRFQAPLLEYIENKTPKGWSIGVGSLPEIGPSDSQVEFKRKVDELLVIEPPNDSSEKFDIEATISSGKILLHLLPKSLERNRLAWDVPVGFIDNSEQRIRSALKKKKKQVRSSSEPVILAIQAGGIGSDFHDYELALFGRTYSEYLPSGEIEESFLTDGVFNNKRTEPPTYAGVLAYVGVYCGGFDQPILFQHPRYTGSYPSEMSLLERRWFDQNSLEVKRHSMGRTDLLDGMRFVVL